MENQFLTGVMQTFGKLLLLSLYGIFVRLSYVKYQIDPIVFSCMSFISTSFILTIIAGPGKYIKKTVLSPYTWFYGVLIFIMYVTDIYVLSYISATENMVLSRFTVPFSLFVSYLLFKRKPSKTDIIGNIFILLGIGLMLSVQNINILPAILALSFTVVFCMTGTSLIMEVHPEANITQISGSFKDRMRVVAFVSFVTSLMFLIVIIVSSLIKHNNGLPTAFNLFVPDLKYFSHGPTILIGLLMGAIFTPIIRYFSWSANYKIKPENVFLILSFMPVVTFILEKLFSTHSGFNINESLLSNNRGFIILISSCLVIFGALVSAFYRMKIEFKKINKGDFLKTLKGSFNIEKSTKIEQVNNTDDYDIIKYSLEFYNNDKAKVAKALSIEETAIDIIYKGKGAYSFKTEARTDIVKKYIDKIATCDGLTGLKNRTWLMSKLKEICDLKAGYKVIFLDLNKFKQINDKYGHEIGDIVLKEIAKRLEKTFGKNNTIRLGGDEFVLLLNNEKATLIPEIKKIIEKPIKDLTIPTEELKVGVAIGIATYPTNGKNPKDLLKHADTDMYKNKNIIK